MYGGSFLDQRFIIVVLLIYYVLTVEIKSNEQFDNINKL